ncbi:putative ABC transport system ATP-binding protein [Micromonospora sp. Llam0]|uniref:ABC transporter transmembrane domain-containing protein n=1 Tax=Micromonospora sp. Llam0 TaxID=2485143 RepID=UPI000F9E7F8A|nr:ABC transporter ATP-binding protein [Micromonospora sp. Llam0]ROO60195.1 putative ABC transport system ATP-binding protein [Micromonospora sp. Llam0]
MPVPRPAPLTAARLLWRTLRRHRGRLTAGVVLLSLHQAAEAAVPLAIGLIVEQAVATGDWTALAVSVAALAALFTVLTFAWRFGARLTETAVHRETHQLRVEVAGRALDPRGHRTGLRSGELLAIAAADAERTALIIRAATVAVAAVAALTVSSVVLLTIDVPLGLGVLLGVPALVLALQALAPVVTRRTGAQQAAAGATTALATDLIDGLRALRGFGAQHNAARRYRESSRHTLQVTLRATTMAGVYQGITAGASGLFLAGVAGAAGAMAVRGRIGVGEFITVVGLAQFIAEPVRALGFCGQLAAAVRASAARVARVLAAPPAVLPGQRPAPRPQPARLALTGVSYRSLRDVDLRLAAGELLAVVAYEPRDAEALLDLLRGAVPAEDHRGTVAVDGVPVAELTLDGLRERVLVEPHDTALFAGTLRSNLLVRPGQAAETLPAAIGAASADDIVAAHPAGLDHPVTDRGASLSGGQRQRIGLARALAADPPILVLHDPTTAVDATTEERLAAGLRAARHGRTVDPAVAAEAWATLVVTSSPALLSRADRVCVLAAGRVVGAAPHHDLVRTDPTYRAAVLR